MKVGVLQFFSWPGRHGPLEDVFARALERIEIMDRGGFDAVWLAEHHFTTFSVCPSVHMLGTLAAARTKRLRIGTAVSLAALYHPLRLAEEVALLDMLSGGRVNWGAGRGFAHSEFNAFGIPPAESTERFHEAVDIVLKAWTQEKLTFAGKHFRFDDVEVLPKPLQAPHPPVWMAATSEAAVDWAASRGFSILMDPHASMADLGAKRRRYGERMAAVDVQRLLLSGQSHMRLGTGKFALLDTGEATLKRFYREGAKIRLQPANKTMEPRFVDADRCKVQGIVIGVLRSYLN